MVLTFPHDYKSPLAKCVVRVDDSWYDVSAWRHSHPGGAEIMDKFHNADCTDAFYSLHSEEAIQKLKRMKGKPVSADDTPRDEISKKFEVFKERLEKEGWYKRNWFLDFTLNVFPSLILCIVGTYFAHSYPLIATLLIGLGMQQAGWIGHDYVHGRGGVSTLLGNSLGGLINGFSSRWWSHKHNTHHTFPNRKEFDSDIHNEPILHLWFPEEKADTGFRQYQHYYFLVVYSFLYASWRMQSLQFVLGSRNWMERILIATNYVWLACLPWYVAVGSILVGGLCVAVVVTANHQTEEIIESDDKYNFIVDQCRSTRGVATPDPFTEFFFGGLQYQLEHHLFPTMPRYHYKSLRPIVKQWCAETGLQFHVSGIVEIAQLNYDVMKKYSKTLPDLKKKTSKKTQ